MFMSRKDSFESAGEEASHNAMLRGVRKFLEKLHQLRQCAVMDHDVVSSCLVHLSSRQQTSEIPPPWFRRQKVEEVYSKRTAHTCKRFDTCKRKTTAVHRERIGQTTVRVMLTPRRRELKPLVTLLFLAINCQSAPFPFPHSASSSCGSFLLFWLRFPWRQLPWAGKRQCLSLLSGVFQLQNTKYSTEDTYGGLHLL